MGYVVRWNSDEWMWEVRRGRSKHAPTVKAFKRRKDALQYKRLFSTNRMRSKKA